MFASAFRTRPESSTFCNCSFRSQAKRISSIITAKVAAKNSSRIASVSLVCSCFRDRSLLWRSWTVARKFEISIFVNLACSWMRVWSSSMRSHRVPMRVESPLLIALSVSSCRRSMVEVWKTFQRFAKVDSCLLRTWLLFHASVCNSKVFFQSCRCISSSCLCILQTSSSAFSNLASFSLFIAASSCTRLHVFAMSTSIASFSRRRFASTWTSLCVS
mmetsp:Transcript_51689/g.102785  ORF Transcript_51689/g.102785 Transcript_51689/m.102785 type:complete len:217 (+) Transcript_51689:246-896(+)